MNDDAEVSMMFYDGLHPDEKAKLKGIEKGVIEHVLSMHENVRPTWETSSTQIQLSIHGKQIWYISRARLATLSPKDILAEIQQCD